jgi:hypothetical protein
MPDDFFFCQQRIRLQSQNWNPADQGVVGIFGFNNVRISQLFGNEFRLAAFSRSIGTRIDLDKPDDIRVHGLDEGDDLVQIILGMLKKAGIGYGQMISVFVAGRIADIVEKKSHDILDSIERGEKMRNDLAHMLSIIAYFIDIITNFTTVHGVTGRNL